MAVLYSNFIGGVTTDNPLTLAATSFNSAALANVPAVASPNIVRIVLDPEAVDGAPEIVYVTAHTSGATSATVARAQESSSAREHAAGTAWVIAATAADFSAGLLGKSGVQKGDLLVATSPYTTARQAAGSDGLPLVAASGQTNGIQYAQLTAAGLASNAVTTAKIQDANVTSMKLADGAVTTAKVGDAQITAAKLAADSVSTAAIQDEAVTVAKLADAVPRGRVASTTSTDTQTGVTAVTDVTGMSVTAALVENRRYKVTAEITVQQLGVVGTVELQLTDGSNNIFRQRRISLDDTYVGVIPLSFEHVAVSTGNQVFKLRCGTSGGTVTIRPTGVTEAGHFLMVEDVGL